MSNAVIGSNAEFIAATCKRPEQITERDIEIVRSTHPAWADEMRAARERALAKTKQAEAERAAAAERQQAAKPSGKYRPMPPMIKADESLQDWIDKYGMRPAPLAAVGALYQATVEGIKMRDEKIQALETRIANLEARPGISYEGTWDATRAYGLGMVTTWDGSMWHCQAPSVGRKPGTDSAFWKLCVKRGADGSKGGA